MHRGMKWWLNNCDIVTVLEHESVLSRECGHRYCGGGDVGVEIFF